MSGFPAFPSDPRQTPPGQNPFADVNPYAAPRAEAMLPPGKVEGLTPYAGLWRQGNLLVMHKQAPLPDICLKSNQPAKRRLQRKLTWHHPSVYLIILLHILIYVVVALIIRKRATIHIPLSEEWFAIRLRRMLFTWGIVLASFVLFGAGIALVDRAGGPAPVFAMLGGLVLLLGGLLYGQYACRMVAPQRMTDDYIWLKGVHPEYLNRLEMWQWNI
jgi:hypothetical protein